MPKSGTLLANAGAVVAVTSSLHKPASLQLSAETSLSSIHWLPLALEGSWPYDKAVEEALPNITHQVLQVHQHALLYTKEVDKRAVLAGTILLITELSLFTANNTLPWLFAWSGCRVNRYVFFLEASTCRVAVLPFFFTI